MAYLHVYITVQMHLTINIFFFIEVEPYSGDICQDIYNFWEFSGTFIADSFLHKIQSKRLEKPVLPLQPLMKATMFITKDE